MLIIELLAAIILGVIAGTFTGLTPGVHINIISTILLSVSGYLLGITSPTVLCVFIISMAIANSFLNAIPSVFLGAPEEGEALIVLPGHRLLLRGMGYEAVKLTVIGSLLSLIACTILIPIMIPFAPKIEALIKPVLGWLLLGVSILIVMKETTWKKRLLSLTIFVISGILGIVAFNLKSIQEPLLPLLSGIFGISSLIISLNSKINLPKQRITDMIKLSKLKTLRSIISSVIAGSITGFFPGVGSAHAAMLGMYLNGRNSGMYSFLIMVGGVNMVNFMFSLVSFYALQKARNGAIITIMEIIKSITQSQLAIFLFAALVTGGICAYLTLKLTMFSAEVMNKINYQGLCIFIIIFVSVMVFIFSGWLGMLLLTVSTALGLTTAILGIGRNNAMGVLMLPVILFFLI